MEKDSALISGSFSVKFPAASLPAVGRRRRINPVSSCPAEAVREAGFKVRERYLYFFLISGGELYTQSLPNCFLKMQ